MGPGEAGPPADLEMLGIPEDADEQPQGELLDLAVQPLLPGPPAGPPVVQVGAGAQVSQVQLVVQLEALDPAGSRRVLSTAPAAVWRRRRGRVSPGRCANAFRMFSISIDNLGGMKKAPLERVYSTRQAQHASREASKHALDPALPLNERPCRQERDAGDGQVAVAGVGDGPVVDVYQNQTLSFL